MNKLRSSGKLWYEVENVGEIFSPSLLVYPDRIVSNIKKMIEIAGGADRLRPHVKTHKMPDVVRLQMKHGITKFKCATISEAEMVARCGAVDILLAMQPVGPNAERFLRLKKKFPTTKISCISDDENVIRHLSAIAVENNIEINIWLDINNGMNRTGVTPGTEASYLYRLIRSLPMIKAEGLHVYDGHIQENDFETRQETCNEAYNKVLKLTDELGKDDIDPIKIIAGGTPSFPIHAKRPDVECSPGTILLWDYKSSSSYRDLEFLYAAVLMTRIISKPGNDLICLDLGHKAVASEMAQPRVIFFGLGDYTIVNHNEEHMVIRTNNAGNLKVGDSLYGIPFHICPTVDRYDHVSVIIDHICKERWNVEARSREITI